MSGVKQFINQWMLPPGFKGLMSTAASRLKGGQQSASEAVQFLEKNRDIFDRHKGERCFILGAGSSIAKQDLKKLAGECVISVSNSFVHPDYPVFKPRYHVLPHILHGHGALYTQEQFVSWLREMEQKTLNAEMFFHIGDKEMIDSNELFKNRIIYWNEYCEWHGNCDFPLDLAKVPSVGSVSEFAITVALYLGFDEIYLLGFDHDWFNGPMVYFYDHKTQHAMQPDEKLIPQVDSEFQMRRHADIFKKYKYLYQMKKNIYNANADAKTYVDTFPWVNYESLFTSLGGARICEATMRLSYAEDVALNNSTL